jgi:hypothetical protein
MCILFLSSVRLQLFENNARRNSLPQKRGARKDVSLRFDMTSKALDSRLRTLEGHPRRE